MVTRLSQLGPVPTVRVAADVLSHAPALAARVMHVIGTWSHIGAEQDALLAAMVRAEPVAGAAMFQALGYPADRSTALLATARVAFSPWKHILLAAVLDIQRPSLEERDHFVRHLWASADELPGTLLLVSAEAAARLAMDDANASSAGISGKAGTDDAYRHILVYNIEDLDASLARAQRVATHSRQLRLLSVEGLDTARQWLISQPDIQKVLPRLVKGAGLDVEDMLRPAHRA